MIKAYATVPAGFTVFSDATEMTFPAGEQHIKTLSESAQTPSHVLISGADANDYVSAAMWIDHGHQGGHTVTAKIPYLPGARQDRGTPFGAQVYANLINSMQADRVVCFDPHSPVMPALVDNLTVVHSDEVIAASLPSQGRDYVGVIAPDAGAVERARRAADALGLPLYRATKVRDFATGKLSAFRCEELPESGRMLVVDDICDGGGTFMGLAQATGLPKDRLDLWVSHGVFSGRAAQIASAYGRIFTTDSHPGHRNPDVNATIVPLAAFLEVGVNA
ncbi:ribose-phosphate pyrophosphokinase [Paeniglutamicibacter sp. NPDC091659]|uniref:ribose-phosphate pyrophosphokinase n=1 Tax=Paeniglutamicibacter sp. NPDC091659 TaxID=3364389 RepID=UPI00382D5FA2